MISGKNSGVVAMSTVYMATCDVSLDVIPQTGGYLPLPDVKLKSYEWPSVVKQDLPKEEETIQEHDKQEKEKQKSETEPEQQQASRTAVSPREPPVVKPFKCGQVYNATQAIQVLVLPSNNDCS